MPREMRSDVPDLISDIPTISGSKPGLQRNHYVELHAFMSAELNDGVVCLAKLVWMQVAFCGFIRPYGSSGFGGDEYCYSTG